MGKSLLRNIKTILTPFLLQKQPHKLLSATQQLKQFNEMFEKITQ